ncbi:MAG TPA: LD-carboxypeptidase [Noviherbaspirillum sp.]|uniref:LD-carboxypeptidase n=1 Tax=Noviherbaspirillum sp. TaxID=1926288 RepID=UPI002F9468B9
MSTGKSLPAGDGVCVAIVAPGGYAPPGRDLALARKRLEAFGWRVKLLHDPADVHQRFAGTDAARAGQLHAAAADPDVHMVLALRGGYGMSRLLPILDLETLAGSGKLFVGHSDFTALQMALLARTGAITFAGPMICDDFTREDASAFTLRSFGDCIGNAEYVLPFDHPGNPALDLSGPLWGGNLTMLAHLAGTPYLSAPRDGILFIEDVNEHPYRVERMLLQLQHAGLLRQQQAIVFGAFTGYRLSDYDNGYDFGAMLDYMGAMLGIPLVCGLPFGHVRDKATLPVGAQARLQCSEGQCLLTLGGYPNLSAILGAGGRGPHQEFRA